MKHRSKSSNSKNSKAKESQEKQTNLDNILVGAGGWSYLGLKGDLLKRYAEIFDFVETNSTFYKVPSDRVARSWRRRVPENFVFSVKCNKMLTHVVGLQANETARKVLERNLRICFILRSHVLILESPYPKEFPRDPEHLARRVKGEQDDSLPTELLRSLTLPYLERAREFFLMANKVIESFSHPMGSREEKSGGAEPDFQLVWEVRGSVWRIPEVWQRLREICAECKITHCTDYAYEEPAYVTENAAYTRIMGSGSPFGALAYELPSVRYEKLKRRTEKLTQKAKKVYVSAHTIKMYDDAMRISEYIKGRKL